MDITNLGSNINATAIISNTVNTSDTTASSTSYSSEASAEVDKEEDAILYQQLKTAGCDLTNHTLDYYKKGLISFPPATAPGNVKRAFRLALQDATPQEKKAAVAMNMYMSIYQKQTGNDTTNNVNVNDYLNSMNDFKQYFTRYQNVLSSGNQYNSFNSFLNSFTTELSKYKSS